MPRTFDKLKLLASITGPLVWLTGFYFNEIPFYQISTVIYWMLSWWLLQPLPLAITALIPIVALPTMQMQPIGEVTRNYAHPLIFLFLGGFTLAKAIEKVGLDKRAALWLISKSGDTAPKLIAGFMLTTALLSMWVSNTATAIMLVPIAGGVLGLSKNQAQGNFTSAILLAIAYAANIGGIATLIGSPPNSLMAAFFKEQANLNISFFDWFKFGFPLALVSLAVCWFILVRMFKLDNFKLELKKDHIDIELKKIGNWTRDEKLVATVFLLTALCWMLESLISKYWIKIPDASVVILACLALYLLPSKSSGRILEWKEGKSISWDILLLFGGGLALSQAIESSGLANFIGESLSSLKDAPFWVVIMLSILIIIFFTEIASNTAASAIFIPILFKLATHLGYPPIYICLPATMAASFAFMLPIATPPNAVVFASQKIPLKTMLKAGFLLNIVFILLLTLVASSIFSHTL